MFRSILPKWCYTFIVYHSEGSARYWVSFQDGLQRTVLFTKRREIVSRVLMGNKIEQPSIDFTLSLVAVGISLVDDIKGIEIGYIGIPQ